jgi:hypothetical protein
LTVTTALGASTSPDVLKDMAAQMDAPSPRRRAEGLDLDGDDLSDDFDGHGGEPEKRTVDGKSSLCRPVARQK